AGLDPAAVQYVGALVRQLLRPAQESVHGEGGALVEEGVRRAVEDPHHQRPGGQVVAAIPERQAHELDATQGLRTVAPSGPCGRSRCEDRRGPWPPAGRRTPVWPRRPP